MQSFSSYFIRGASLALTAQLLVACGGGADSGATPSTPSSIAQSSMQQSSMQASNSVVVSSSVVSSSSVVVTPSSMALSSSSIAPSSAMNSSAVSSSSEALPLCTVAANGVAYCQQGDLTDADESGVKDGWGWENDASCIVLHGAGDVPPGNCRIDTPETGGGTSPDHIMYNGEKVYLSGFNVAWIDFAADFGAGFNEAKLREALVDVSSSGGNSLRWWLHTDGSKSPEWGNVNGAQQVVGTGGTTIADLQKALDIAAEYNVYIVPALWSFDMLLDNSFRKTPTQNNYQLLSNDDVLQSYLDNALVPMVKALNKHPQLIAWELFNEPENMTETWFRERTEFYGGPIPTKAQLQRTQAKMAAAIHREALANGEVALVTTGSKSMGKYNSDVAGGSNWYSDEALIAAADGDTQATLDFYEPHYYNNEGRNGAWSPFHHKADYWGVNKPIVVGEFYVKEALDVLDDKVEKEDLCQRLADYGYAGGWPWQWNENPDGLKECISRVP